MSMNAETINNLGTAGFVCAVGGICCNSVHFDKAILKSALKGASIFEKPKFSKGAIALFGIGLALMGVCALGQKYNKTA